MRNFFLKSVITALAFCLFLPVVYAQSPYESSWAKEVLIFGTGFLVAFTAAAIDEDLDSLTIGEINDLNKNDINWFDKSTAGNYSVSIAKASDYTVAACLISPFFLLLDSKIRNDAGTITTMYLETIFFSTFIPSYGKGGVQRIRPWAYSPDAPWGRRREPESRRSFPSGHASWAFSSAVFFATVYSDYYPNSKWKNYIWGGALLTASSVAYFRVGAGAHFPTDVLAGAVVGSAVGYLIPYLHRKNTDSDLTFLPRYQERQFQLSMNYSF